ELTGAADPATAAGGIRRNGSRADLQDFRSPVLLQWQRTADQRRRWRVHAPPWSLPRVEPGSRRRSRARLLALQGAGDDPPRPDRKRKGMARSLARAARSPPAMVRGRGDGADGTAEHHRLGALDEQSDPRLRDRTARLPTDRTRR